MNLLGGESPFEPLTPEETAKFTPIVTNYIEQQTGKVPTDLQILGKSIQIVNGTNYFLKVIS